MKSNSPFQVLDEATVPVGELVDDPSNVNVHDEDNLAAIQASFQAFGQVERIVVRKSTNTVYAGNGRLEVARRMNLETLRVQYVEGTETQCRAYAISSNRTTRMSRFDDRKLLDALQDIQAEDTTPLLAASGFDLQNLQDLTAELQDKAAAKGKGLKRGSGGSLAVCPDCGKEFRLGT